jgi:hypothetical protein
MCIQDAREFGKFQEQADREKEELRKTLTSANEQVRKQCHNLRRLRIEAQRVPVRVLCVLPWVQPRVLPFVLPFVSRAVTRRKVCSNNARCMRLFFCEEAGECCSCLAYVPLCTVRSG